MINPRLPGLSPGMALIGQTQSTHPMTIDRPMFPPRAESVDSSSCQPATGQPETRKRTSESRKPAAGLGEVMTNIIDFRSAAARLLSHVPTEHSEPRVTGRQRASRKRNPLRQPCHSVSHAVTVAGKLHRGEALRIDPYLDEGAILWKGVEAARLLLGELFELAVKQGGSVDQ